MHRTAASLTRFVMLLATLGPWAAPLAAQGSPPQAAPPAPPAQPAPPTQPAPPAAPAQPALPAASQPAAPAPDAPAQVPPAEGAPPTEGAVRPVESAPAAPAPATDHVAEAAPQPEVVEEMMAGGDADETSVAGAGEATAPEILVTGSRVKRTSFSMPSPVEVISRKELEMSGANNMADVVKHMTINYGSESNPDLSTAAGGTSQFNLRGLGLNSTLVLLNGRRLVPAATISTDGTSFVDINQIPVALIERVEILKGGASAIYGSDAVAGVVNIITRKDMDGFEAQVGGQTTDDVDQHEWDVSLAGGARGERTRLTGVVAYFKRDPLDAEDRAFTDNGRNVSLLGSPSAFLRQNQFGDDASGFTDPACGMDPLSATHTEPSTALLFCTFNFNPYFQLVMDEERVNTYGTIEHDVSDHTRAFVEGGYAASRTIRSVSPSFPLVERIIIPAEHPLNTQTTDLRWIGRTLGGGDPASHQFFDSDTLHTVAGFGGDFGGAADDTTVGRWEWELAGTYSHNQFRFGLSDTLIEPLRDALDCEPHEDPALCWNPFSAGPPNTQDLTDAVHGELRTVSETQLTTANGELNGPIIELPGGDLSLAFGGQMRRETAASDVDHDANELAYVFLVGGPDYQAERYILAGYGEVVMPFAPGLEVEAAGRVEGYEDVGSTFDPRAGVSWTPAESFLGGGKDGAVETLRLRSTIATSFRAPSLLQMYGAQTEIAETFDVSDDGMGNPLADERSIYRAVRTSGEPTLKPETSIAFSGGIEWKPVKEVTLEGDYWRYDFDDLVVKENHQEIIAADFMCSTDPTSCDPRITRDQQGSVQRVEARFINAPSVLTDGIDFAVTYKSDLGGETGTYEFEGNGTYVVRYEIQTYPGGPTIDAAGNRNFSNAARPIPRLRLNFPLSWQYDGHGAHIVTHFISGYENDEIARSLGIAAAEQAPTLADIDPWVTIDFQYSIRVEENDDLATTFKVGMLNLLDSDPPALDAAYGYDVFTHDPRGRMLYGRLIQEF